MLLSACSSPDDRELARLCEAQTPFRQALQVGDAADAAVQARFGSACFQLVRAEGLEFTGSDRVYVCKSTIYRQPDNPRALQSIIQQTRAFGRPLKIEDFDPLASEPDDIRARTDLKQKAPEAMLARRPLGFFTSYAGINGSFLILTDSAGAVQDVLYTYGDFDRAIHAISSLSGAMLLLEIKNQAGFGGAKREQCLIKSIKGDSTGWSVRGLPVKRNCLPPVVRDVHIGRNGAVVLEQEYSPPPKPFEAIEMSCGD